MNAASNEQDVIQYLQPDRGIAETYVAALAGSVEAPLTFQTCPAGDGESGLAPTIFHGTLSDAWERLCEAQERAHGVFVMVNEGDGLGRRAGNVRALRALFADADGEPVPANLLQPPPSMIVRSGHGEHYYWLLRPGEALDAFTPAQKAIARRLGTDAKVCDLPRVLRLPGTYNLKDRSCPKLVELVSCERDRRYSAAEVLEGLGASAYAAPHAEPVMPARALGVVPAAAIEEARRYIAKIPAVQGDNGDTATFRAAAVLLREFSLDRDTAWELLREWNQTNASPPWDEQGLWVKLVNAEQYASHAVGTAYMEGRNEPAARDYESERGRTEAFIADEATRDGQRVIVFWRGDYYSWEGSRWDRMEVSGKREVGLESRIVQWLERVGQRDKVTTRTLDSMLRLLPSSAIRLPESVEDGAWIGEGEPPVPSAELVPLANGQFHVPTRRVLPHTPGWFNLSSRPFAWDESADCLMFRAALSQWFEGDPEGEKTLQEIVGYIAAGRTDLEKAFYLYGVRRSGKSTIADVIESLVGREYVTSPSLRQLGKDFGLESFIGKRLVIFRDARQIQPNESSAASEAILRITGRDSMTIPRKFRSDWKGILNTSIVMISNVVARFNDASSTVATRFIFVGFPHSFLGKEDPTLKRRILDELPGIFRWALEGLDRLTKRGHFVQPESGDDARESMERSSSPVGAFIDDRVEFALSVETSEDYLYGQYRDWCAANGHEAGAKTTFIENLISYSLGLGHSEVRKSRPGQRGEARARCVTGVRVAVPSLSGVVALHGDGPGPRFGAQPALWNDRRAA